MNDRDLDQLIARANPFGDDTVRQLPTANAESDLMEGILTTPTTRRSLPRRPVLLAAAAAVVAAAVAGGAVAATTGGETQHARPPGRPYSSTPHIAYAANVREVAEANQRLLLDEPGWKITHVDQFTVAEGEVFFENGSKSLDVSWRATGDYQGYYDDRGADGNTKTPITLLGQHGTMFTYTDANDFTTILPPKGQNFLEIRGEGASEQAYRDLLAKLHPVDVDTWLAAMPASVVKPADTRATVDAMLAGLPLPSGLDKQRLYRQPAEDRYDLGAAVSGAVACGWLDQWVAAKQSGDASKLKQAVDALATSHGWKVLHDMNAEGDYPEVVWQYADQVAKGQSPEYYQQGLGC
jgi:hypothetical protein